MRTIDIGSVLLRMGAITKEQLDAGVAQQKLTPSRKLGEILVDQRSVTADTINEALQIQRAAHQGKTLGQARTVLRMLTRAVDRFSATTKSIDEKAEQGLRRIGAR